VIAYEGKVTMATALQELYSSVVGVSLLQQVASEQGEIARARAWEINP